jgi:plasmid stability protein
LKVTGWGKWVAVDIVSDIISDMPDLLIRNVAQDAVDRLKARAAQRGVSLNTLLRETVEAAPLSVEGRLAAFDAVRARVRSGGPTGAELIREDRNRR